MAAITICSDFGAPNNKVSHCFHCFPIYLPWSERTRCHDLVFWMLSFKPTFSLSSFTFINRYYNFPGGASGKEPVCQCRRHKDVGLIPRLGRSPGGGHSNPFQYSCLENPMHSGAWRDTADGRLQSMGSLRVGHDWVTELTEDYSEDRIDWEDAETNFWSDGNLIWEVVTWVYIFTEMRWNVHLSECTII